jgi:hypothetical protein
MSRMRISDYQKGDQPTLLITSDIVSADYLCFTALDRIWMVIHKYVINISMPHCGFSLVFLDVSWIPIDANGSPLGYLVPSLVQEKKKN